MAQSDTILFEKWRTANDADAFAELLSRHANMVYGACLRVVRNPSVAEDVAQESFLELMKGPVGVQSFGGWLHTVATRRALDRVKAEGRRLERETAYAATVDIAVEATWDDVREYVDEAIEALPEELRVPIVLRFLEARPQNDIARELGLSRSAVRLRINKGIDLVRESLAKRGVLCTVAALTAMFERVPVEAAPDALVAELGRRALAMRTGQKVAAGSKYALATVLLAGVVLGGAWIALGRRGVPETAPFSDGRDTVTAVLTTPEPVPPEDQTDAPTVSSESEADETLPVNEKNVAMVEKEEKSGTGWQLDLTPSEKVLQAMQRPVTVRFQNTHISDILKFMQGSYDVNLVLDSRVVAPVPDDGEVVQVSRRYVTDGHIGNIDQQGKTMEEALSVLTTMVNLTYKVRGNLVWISSSAEITRDLTVPLPSAPFREAEILDSISDQPAYVNLYNIHVFDLVKAIGRPLGISIVVDKRVVIPFQKKGEEPPPVLSTYATDGMIEHICLDSTGAEMLFVLTRLLDLTYRVDTKGVYISTPDRVRGSF